MSSWSKRARDKLYLMYQYITILRRIIMIIVDWSLLFLFSFLFLLLFLLFLALLQKFLEIVHDLLVSEDSELYQQKRISFFHQSNEFRSCSIINTVSIHIDVYQSWVFSKHFFYFFNHRNFLRLTKLIVADVQLTESFICLECSEELIDTFIAQLISNKWQMFNFAIMIRQYLLKIKGSFIIDSTSVEDKLF